MGLVRVMMICLGIVVKLAAAVDHTVGGPSGWIMGIDFATWGSSQAFLVGDKLLFEYTSVHSVVEVQKADYSNCEISTPIATYFDSSTTITLTTPGNRYFICVTPGHCNAGMKLEVNIVAPPSPSTRSPQPLPPPPELPTSPPPKAPSSPPPQLPTSPPPNAPSSTPQLPSSPSPKAPSSPPPQLSTSPPSKAPSTPLSPLTSPESPSSSPLPRTTPAAGPAPPKSSASRGNVFSMFGWFIAILTGLLIAI